MTVKSFLLSLFKIRGGCPKCGSRSENWHPESEACADCGYGVAFYNPLAVARGGRVTVDPMLLEQFMDGQMTEDDFAQASLAGGMRAASALEIIDQRRADFHERGEEPPE
jgi:predicted  nucleic acid-binding Zn-ribbon protein